MSNTSLPVRLLVAALVLAGGCESRAIHAVEMVPGANVSVGLVTGNANVSGNAVSSTSVGIGANAMEFGARGVAYYCVDDESRDRSVDG